MDNINYDDVTQYWKDVENPAVIAALRPSDFYFKVLYIDGIVALEVSPIKYTDVQHAMFDQTLDMRKLFKGLPFIMYELMEGAFEPEDDKITADYLKREILKLGFIEFTKSWNY